MRKRVRGDVRKWARVNSQGSRGCCDGISGAQRTNSPTAQGKTPRREGSNPGEERPTPRTLLTRIGSKPVRQRCVHRASAPSTRGGGRLPAGRTRARCARRPGNPRLQEQAPRTDFAVVSRDAQPRAGAPPCTAGRTPWRAGHRPLGRPALRRLPPAAAPPGGPCHRPQSLRAGAGNPGRAWCAAAGSCLVRLVREGCRDH